MQSNTQPITTVIKYLLVIFFASVILEVVWLETDNIWCPVGVAIIAGGIIWGVAGMVLFIPFVAILKIIRDHIEECKPVNLLLSRD